jgi:NAD+ kinase
MTRAAQPPVPVVEVHAVPAVTGRPTALPYGLSSLGLVMHPYRDTSEVLENIASWAATRRIRLLAAGTSPSTTLPGAVTMVPRRQLAEAADLLAAIGGDGTVLGALRLAADTRTPVLGVAFGHLGYLTETTPERLTPVLDELAAGQHVRTLLPVLDVRCRAASGRAPALAVPTAHAPVSDPVIAVNDVVLARTAGHGQASLAVTVGGDLFVRYSTDAVIIATPLGSTAYSLSAGGPIASVSLDMLLITPVAPSGFFSRSLLVAPTDVVEITVLDDSAPVTAEADGQLVATLRPGASIEVRSSPARTALVRLDATASFYARVRRRLAVPDALILGPVVEP